MLFKAVLLVFLTAVVAWSAQELEIFRLHDQIIDDLGIDTTFYSWLGIDKSSSGGKITAAYRKLSRRLHPDKNPGLEAQERFSRLSRVHSILRSSARDTYDFYLKKGFPEVRAGDYLFKRYRPGFITAILLVVLLITGTHYVLLRVHTSRMRSFYQGIIDEALEKARSSSNGAITSKKRVILENKKTVIVYPDTSVFYLDGTTEVLVDSAHIKEVTIRDAFPLNFLPKKEVEGHKLGEAKKNE